MFHLEVFLIVEEKHPTERLIFPPKLHLSGKPTLPSQLCFCMKLDCCQESRKFLQTLVIKQRLETSHSNKIHDVLNIALLHRKKIKEKTKG